MIPNCRDLPAVLIGLALTLAGVAAGAGKTGKVAVGSRAEEFTFTDIRFLRRTLDDLGKPKAFAIAFVTTECPLARRYLPRLQELSAEYRTRGVQFIAVNVGADDSLKAVAYQALEQGVDFPFVKDFHGDCARALGATRTPEVVVLDAGKNIRYRGRIDNQYRLGGVKPSADRQDLVEAIEDILAGRDVKEPETPVDGCVITFPETKADPSLTYAKDVAPLINKHCVECHRPGTAAPFVLTSFEKVCAKADSIAEVVEEERMPPWFAHPGFGRFLNQRGLTPKERETIVQWVRGGRASGDLAQAPRPPEFPESKWLIGEPDLVITASQPEKLPATGYIPYRYVMLVYVFTADTWVQGIQILPGNPRVVHHANLAYVSLGNGFDESRNFLTGIVPGGIPVQLDSGCAMMIPAGSMLALQVHYVTTGKEETDQISVGLRFAREPVQKRVRYKILGDYKFRIPPGAPAHPVAAQRELECDATGVGLFSHMHLRGKDSTFLAHYPDGRTETLLALPNYSFDWQLSYVWPRDTQKFPKGTRIECRSHFDNSPFNPYNPDPTVTVRNGPQTHHEMMQGFFFYTDDAEHLNLKVDPKTGRAIRPEGKSGTTP
jgi:thiol-disulfide isomerase/thioredoxin